VAVEIALYLILEKAGSLGQEASNCEGFAAPGARSVSLGRLADLTAALVRLYCIAAYFSKVFEIDRGRMSQQRG
jgi:hypothetical protein